MMSFCTSAFALPSATTRTLGGSHLRCVMPLAVQLIWQLGSTFGGLKSPEHLGSLTSALHPPLQLPSHFAPALSSHEPEHLPSHAPVQVPCALASHLPSQVPLQGAFLESLPSHLPSQLPP